MNGAGCGNSKGRTGSVHGENISCNARGTLLQRRAAMRNNASRSGSYLSSVLVGDGVSINVSRVGRVGSGERSWYLRAFPLFFLPAKSESINGNCEKGCKVKLMPKKSILSG